MADSVLILLAVLPALLVAFLYKIVTLPQELSVPTPPPEPPPEPDPSAPRELAPPARPLWQAPAAPLPAGAAGQPGDAGYRARHTPAAVPRRSPPQPRAASRGDRPPGGSWRSPASRSPWPGDGCSPAPAWARGPAGIGPPWSARRGMSCSLTARSSAGPSAWLASSSPSPGSTWPCASARGSSPPGRRVARSRHDGAPHPSAGIAPGNVTAARTAAGTTPAGIPAIRTCTCTA